MKVDFERVLLEARAGELDNEAIAALARGLAESGEILSPLEIRAADLSSTGGPSSLSTLWAPAVLAAKGWRVPKLGVAGRPAGGVDVLAQIPGFRTKLTLAEAKTVLEKCGYVHIEAGEVFAPADAALFRYRQANNAQAIPALVIASLLSKKLAMGVGCVGLEVRVAAHGNFGAALSDARANARQFCDVAALLGLKAVCILTDASKPYQPFLGRGESLLALSLLFSGRAPDWLARHARCCETWAAAVVERAPKPVSALATAHAFAANVIAQGGSLEMMEEVAMRVASSHRKFILASRDGVVSFDLGRLRDAIVSVRSSPHKSRRFPDDAGVILLVEPGQSVGHHQPIASIRCGDEWMGSFEQAVNDAVDITDGWTQGVAAGATELIGV